MHKVFIDGAEGTVGIDLAERLEKRDDIEIIKIAPELRKDAEERARVSSTAEIVFLCLPDDAAGEAANRITSARVIDASTGRRTAPGWTYGLPELSSSYKEAVRNASRVANPGCYPAGFLVIAYPLIESGLAAPDYPFFCFGLSGYSGAGKSGVKTYESPNRDERCARPLLYGLGQNHKHLREMKEIAGLDEPPVFNPIICDFYKGMTVTVPLRLDLFKKKISAAELHNFYAQRYQGAPTVEVAEFGAAHDDKLDGAGLPGVDGMRLYICGTGERATVTAAYDNLGKGAAGAAVLCMNIMLGLEETKGLRI